MNSAGVVRIILERNGASGVSLNTSAMRGIEAAMVALAMTEKLDTSSSAALRRSFGSPVTGSCARADRQVHPHFRGGVGSGRSPRRALSAARIASTRLRLTPKSLLPSRDAERTWISEAFSSSRNSTSST